MNHTLIHLQHTCSPSLKKQHYSLCSWKAFFSFRQKISFCLVSQRSEFLCSSFVIAPSLHFFYLKTDFCIFFLWNFPCVKQNKKLKVYASFTPWSAYTVYEQIFLINLLKPTGHEMHQQLYSLPTLYLCVLYLSENKQRLVPLTA